LYAQKTPVAANLLFNKAYNQSIIEKKNVLMTFYGFWNPWSYLLDSIMRKPACRKILSKYYIPCTIIKEETAIANPGADDLFSKYFEQNDTLSSETRKVPCMFIIKHKKKLAQFQGFPEAIEGRTAFGNLLKQTSKITAKELEILNSHFENVSAKFAVPSSAKVLSAACKQAAAENKKVFLIFHASWCHWCHVLDTAMAKPACSKFFTDNYVICHLIAHESDNLLLQQNAGAEEMLMKYQKNRNGIPFWIIFDNDGKWLADFNGFPVPRLEEYKEFERILKQTSNMTALQLDKIREVFNEMSPKQ
jgi:thioredoxin-related protein